MRARLQQPSYARGLLCLTGLIIRDGSLYFLGMLILNVAQMILAARLPGNNYLSFYVTPLTSMLLSRFLLHLREAVYQKQPGVPTSFDLTRTSGSGSLYSEDVAACPTSSPRSNLLELGHQDNTTLQ
ncbi:hypothetical protein PsYK624_028190 [Phanerochaete sordida]|uniref:Uncharacterized protein n=1 Tax=Phanerochaete sordida TaxID=48140 RepID=A0A9P3G1V8_9APHY|nr:hypothetical protein PsYK624_028190 [Phanerochaete sordida]